VAAFDGERLIWMQSPYEMPRTFEWPELAAARSQDLRFNRPALRPIRHADRGAGEPAEAEVRDGTS
jgi:hypothetical protein